MNELANETFNATESMTLTLHWIWVILRNRINRGHAIWRHQTAGLACRTSRTSNWTRVLFLCADDKSIARSGATCPSTVRQIDARGRRLTHTTSDIWHQQRRECSQMEARRLPGSANSISCDRCVTRRLGHMPLSVRPSCLVHSL